MIKTFLFSFFSALSSHAYQSPPDIFYPPFNSNQGWTLNMRLKRTMRINLKQHINGILKIGNCKFQIVDNHTYAVNEPSEYNSGGIIYPGATRILKGTVGTYGEFLYEIDLENHFDRILNHTAIVPWLRGNTLVTSCRPAQLIATGYFEALKPVIHRNTDHQGSIIGGMPTEEMPQLLTNEAVAATDELRERVREMEETFARDPELRDMPGFVVSDPPGSDAARDLAAGRRRDKAFLFNSDCLNVSGHFTHYMFGQWIMKAAATQTDCQSVSVTYTIPDGTRFTRVLLLDDNEHVIGQDGQGMIHFEKNRATSNSFELSGRTEVDNAIKSTWVGRWTLGKKGELIDYSEEFSATGRSEGPLTTTFQRD